MSKCVKCGNEILTGDIHWEMGLCNSCYNELYKDHKTHISLDKMWLKLAQDFRDENEKLQKQIADLEAKLAEKEKEYKRLLYIASKMHLWIFNNNFDEQAVYDELGLTDEENALLGYGGEFKFKIKEKK